ncbi:MAG: acetate--CoA ligase family protein [Alicyclobacillaceae bacterium]|nr:acetate--CoA ligase family protein [Alicyclobacillaceae bacterium]
MTALGKAVWWYENRRTATFELPDRAAIQSSGIEGPPKGSWSEYKARQFLEQAGIPVVPAALVTTAEEAALAAKAIGFPVAMKIHSEDIAHKSDVGGVVLDVQNERDVSAAFKRMVETVSLKSPSSRIEGVLVSPMRRAGTELLVGIVKDPLWGQVLAVGLGGIFVEVLKDTVIRVLPVSREDVLQMLRELRGADVLMGSRGRVVANMDNVVDVIYRLSLVAMNVSDSLQALEVNPLWVSGSAVEALDVLLTWG